MEFKFKVGDAVYVVQDYKVIKVTVKEIVYHVLQDNSFVEYKIISKQLTSDGKVKDVERTIKESSMVKDFEEAKQAAITNWETIYNNVKKQLYSLTEQVYDAEIK